MNRRNTIFQLIAFSFILTFTTASFASPSASENYLKHCAVCHGANGDGHGRITGGMTPPPRDFTSELSSIELTQDRMIKSIREGRPGTTMTGWKKRLSDAEIISLANHIKTTFIKKKAGAKKASFPPQLAKRMKVGEQLYTENCSVCHGDYGQTGVWTQSNMATAPRNFTSDRARGELSRGRMIESITFGVPGKAMMAYGSRLNPEQVESVVDYVRIELMKLPIDEVLREAAAAAASTTSVSSSVTPDFVNSADYMRRPFLNNSKGDPNEGRKLFVRNCWPCHGVNGDGQGPRAFFINPKPRNFISADARRALNRPRIFKAVNDGLRGSVMPAWGKVLTQQQVADVSEFVFRAFIRNDMRGVSQTDITSTEQKKN